jgi:hypothetical protein
VCWRNGKDGVELKGGQSGCRDLHGPELEVAKIFKELFMYGLKTAGVIPVAVIAFSRCAMEVVGLDPLLPSASHFTRQGSYFGADIFPLYHLKYASHKPVFNTALALAFECKRSEVPAHFVDGLARMGAEIVGKKGVKDVERRIYESIKSDPAANLVLPEWEDRLKSEFTAEYAARLRSMRSKWGTAGGDNDYRLLPALAGLFKALLSCVTTDISTARAVKDKVAGLQQFTHQRKSDGGTVGGTVGGTAGGDNDFRVLPVFAVLFKAIIYRDIAAIAAGRLNLVAVEAARDASHEGKSSGGQSNRVYGFGLTKPHLPEGCICLWCKLVLSKAERDSFNVLVDNGSAVMRFRHKCSVAHPEEMHQHGVSWKNFPKMLAVAKLEKVRVTVAKAFYDYSEGLLEDWYEKHPSELQRKRHERK